MTDVTSSSRREFSIELVRDTVAAARKCLAQREAMHAEKGTTSTRNEVRRAARGVRQAEESLARLLARHAAAEEPR